MADVLLAPDVLHLVLEVLGAIEFTRASPCRAWSQYPIPPDHALWKEACAAVSPLLLTRHAPPLATWKALVRQHRRAHAPPPAHVLAGTLAYELHQSALPNSPILRAGHMRLEDALHDETRLVLDPPLPVTLESVCALTMQLSVISPDNQICRLGGRLPGDEDASFNVWWKYQPEGAISLDVQARYGGDFALADEYEEDEEKTDWVLTGFDVSWSWIQEDPSYDKDLRWHLGKMLPCLTWTAL